MLLVSCVIAVFLLHPNDHAANIATYVLALNFVLTLIISAKIKPQIVPFRLPHYSLFLALYVAISTLWSDAADLEKFLRELANAVLVLGFYFSVVNSTTSTRPRQTIHTFIVAAGLAALSMIISHIQDHDVFYRMSGFGSLENPLVAANCFGIALCFLVLDRTHWPYKGHYVAALLLITAILMLQTKSTIIALTVAAVTYWCTHSERSRLAKTLVPTSFILCALGALGATYLLAPQHFTIEPTGLNLTSFRITIWQAYLNDLWSSGDILFGQGLLANTYIANPYKEAFINYPALYFFEHPHSLLLSTVYYSGIVGGILLLVHYILQIASSLTPGALFRRQGMIALLAYCCVCLLLDGNKLVDKINFVWILFWLPAALLSAKNLKPELNNSGQREGAFPAR